MTIGLMILSGCSSTQNEPRFSASGYTTPSGVVRLWRQDENQHYPKIIMNVFSPYQGGSTIVSLYQYQQGHLQEIRRERIGDLQEDVLLRFDETGEVSFMQRHLATRREALSAQDIVEYQQQAAQVLASSERLRSENIQLYQGVWQSGRLVNCRGDHVQPNFSTEEWLWLEQRQRGSVQKRGVAWIESPSQHRLLLVANEDFCRWQPDWSTSSNR